MPIDSINRTARNIVLAQLPAFSGLAAIAGFLSDVLAPLAPLAQYAAIAFAVLAVGAFSLYGLLKSQKILSVGILCAFLGIANIGVSIFQSYFQLKDTGILGGNIEAVAALQRDLGLISEKLDKIAVTVDDIAGNTNAIAEETRKANSTLETIRDGFDVLLEQNDLIANPTTPEQYYVNAVKYMQRGNNTAALTMFEKVFSSQIQPIDAAEQYFNLLKTLNGNMGALQEVQQQIKQTNNLSLKAVYAFHSEPDAADELDALLEQNSTYSPLHYLHAQALIKNREIFRVPTTTRVRTKQELELFAQASESGEASRFFIDKGVLAKWMNNTESTLQKFSELRSVEPEGSVDISGQDGDWCLAFQFTDIDKKILAKSAGDDGADPIVLSETTEEVLRKQLETWRDGANSKVSLCVQNTLEEMRREYWFSEDGMEMMFAYIDLDNNAVTFSGRFPNSDWVSKSLPDGTLEVQHTSGIGLLRTPSSNYQIFYRPEKPISNELRNAPMQISIGYVHPSSVLPFDAFGLSAEMKVDVEANRYVTQSLSKQDIEKSLSELRSGKHPDMFARPRPSTAVLTTAIMMVLQETREASVLIQSVGSDQARYNSLGARYKFDVSQSGAKSAFSTIIEH